jgi:hypothetical protein
LTPGTPLPGVLFFLMLESSQKIIRWMEAGMAKGPKYRHRQRDDVTAALKVMLEATLERLKEYDARSVKSESVAEQRQINKHVGLEQTEEELEEMVRKNRIRSTEILAHLDKRSVEVRALLNAFESKEPPSKEILAKTYYALRDCFLYEAIRYHYVLPPHVRAKAKRSALEDKRLHAMHMYSRALAFGFGMLPDFSWSFFPFDDL